MYDTGCEDHEEVQAAAAKSDNETSGLEGTEQEQEQVAEQMAILASLQATKSPESHTRQLEVESPSAQGPGTAYVSFENQPWRSMLFEQATKRDEPNQGLLALYEQYSKCQRSLQALDDKSSNHRVGKASEVTEASEANQEQLKNMEKMMRQKDAELLALQRQNKELQEELHEKELAHAHTGREATRLSQENGRLKTELEKMREARIRAETPQAPRTAGTAGSDVDRASEALSEPVELPEEPKVLCNLQTELTCVSAGLQSSSGSALPRSLVALGTSDGYVKLVDALTGRLEAHLSVARQLPKVVDLQLAEASLLLVASSDQAVRLLDLRRQKLLHTMRGHRGLVSACGWLQGSRAFTAGADRTVKLWDVEKGQIIRSIPCAGPVTTARGHRQSGVVVAGHADGRLSVFDQRLPESAEPVRLHQSAQAVVGVQLSQDGSLVLSQAQDGSVCCTALGCPEPMLRLQASGPLDSGPSPPAFSPDGASILARGAASVHCWTRDGQLVYNHDLQPTVAVSWDLKRAISIHRTGHFYSWGSTGSAQTGSSGIQASSSAEPRER